MSNKLQTTLRAKQLNKSKFDNQDAFKTNDTYYETHEFTKQTADARIDKVISENLSGGSKNVKQLVGNLMSADL